MTVFHELTAVKQLREETEEWDTFRHYQVTGKELYYCNCGWSSSWVPCMTRDEFEQLKEKHPHGSLISE